MHVELSLESSSPPTKIAAGSTIGLCTKLKTMEQLEENTRGTICSLRKDKANLRTLKEHEKEIKVVDR